MYPFKKISELENKELLKYPVYITLLAENSADKLDENEIKTTAEAAHINTFICDTLLTDFYKEVNVVFENNMEEIEHGLPAEKSDREATINSEITHLDKIILKLGKEYTIVMHQSMKLFKEHVSNSQHNFILDLVLPIPIPGLTK